MPAQSKEYFQQYYLRNKEKYQARAKLYNPAYRRSHTANRLLSSAKHRAKVRDLAFSISLADIVIPPVCPVFKRPFEVGTVMAASVDRIDPTEGYVPGNIQILSRKANLMKQDASISELRDFASWINTSVL